MQMRASLLCFGVSVALVIDSIKVPLSPKGKGLKIIGKNFAVLDKIILEKYTDVTKIIISDTSFDDIPDGIELLTELESVVFTNNKRKEFGLPLSLNKLAGLKKLKHLDLSGNQMGTLGISIANLKSLEHLNVSRNELDTVGRFLKHNVTLRHIDFSYNKIKTLDSTMKHLGFIRTLNLKGNMLSKLCPEFLELTNLKELNLSKNEFTSIPNEALVLSNLLGLSMDQNKITSIDYPVSTRNTGNFNKSVVAHDMVNALNFYKRSQIAGDRIEFNIRMFNKTGYCLSNLKYLSLKNNEITSVTDAILLFQKLRIIRLNCNSLVNVSDSLYTLQKLLPITSL